MAIVVAGNNTEPVEPPLQKPHEDWNSVHGLKQRRRLLQSVSCRSSEREDDVKDTQRGKLRLLHLTTPWSESWPKKETEVGRVCSQRNEGKNVKLICILK